MTGIELIEKEKKKQIEKHDRTVKWDRENNADKSLYLAAWVLIDQQGSLEWRIANIPPDWGTKVWNKMCRKSYRERLIIAGALIAAEIDRLQYEG